MQADESAWSGKLAYFDDLSPCGLLLLLEDELFSMNEGECFGNIPR